ncbi:hypothetical protein C1646_753312 [Rhizophagus diaphanus]|nr:hypothetical protein C1646_753312 [Rhizophagus diaphanus] [Rhizophagus sp. MUCL 43196]
MVRNDGTPDEKFLSPRGKRDIYDPYVWYIDRKILAKDLPESFLNKAVPINESIKCIISERVVSIEVIDNKFSDLFDAITLGQYNDREVKVFIRQEKSENWQEVDNGLKGDLKILEVLGENAFSILMQNSRKLLLPQRITEYNNCDRLYNEIIELLQDLKVGWMGEEWICLQFCPTNAIATRSIHHTGRFNVKFKIQGRLLQKNSDDAHYYDKHKVPIGEDVAVSTGVRNWYSMVDQNSILAAADHDFTKLSLTPSVTFFISIPEDIFESFYDSQVFVSYKDTTFEPSSAIRHSTEFLNALNIQYEHQTNLAERIMSILNLGLQGVALKRNQMSPESEALFEMANTLDDIRKKAQEFNELNSELIETSEETITKLFEKSIFVIDPTLKIDETTQSQIHRHSALIEFMGTYCHANAESIPKSILVVGKIRSYIDCEDCKKRHCVYSDKFLNSDKQKDFQQVLESYSYSCGIPIFPDDHYLKKVVFVRTCINCDSPIEVLYYSSCKSGNYPICYYCGESEGLVAPPESLKQRFKQIYPLYEMCIENRKSFHTKGEIKTNERASKCRKI